MLPSTRLKERILVNLPGLHAYKEKCDVYLAFEKYIGLALKKSHDKDCDNDAIIIAQAADIVRKHMLEHKSSFSGVFKKESQVNSVPKSLMSLITMMLFSSNIKDQLEKGPSQATVSIAQLLQYNVHSGRSTSTIYHQQYREPPLPVYLGLKVH